MDELLLAYFLLLHVMIFCQQITLMVEAFEGGVGVRKGGGEATKSKDSLKA